jgi:hypothetical protein
MGKEVKSFHKRHEGLQVILAFPQRWWPCLSFHKDGGDEGRRQGCFRAVDDDGLILRGLDPGE